MRWEGRQQRGRRRGQGQCDWWRGCKLLPLAVDSPGGVESGRSWQGPGRREFRSQWFHRQQGPGRRHCCGSERVLGLALGLCGRVLLQSGTDLKTQKNQRATLMEEVSSSPLGLLLEPKPALSEKAGAGDSAKSGKLKRKKPICLGFLETQMQSQMTRQNPRNYRGKTNLLQPFEK